MPWECLAESSWLDVFQNALWGHWSYWDCVLQKAEEQLKCGISSGPVRVSAWNKTRERQNAPAVGDVRRRLFPCLSTLGVKKEKSFPVGLCWSWGRIVPEKKTAWEVY